MRPRPHWHESKSKSLIRERLEEAAEDKLVLFPNPMYDPPAFEGTAANIFPVKYPVLVLNPVSYRVLLKRRRACCRQA